MEQDIEIYDNMFYRQLPSLYIKQLFNKNKICKICNKEIKKYELLVMQRRHEGRSIENVFAHESCYIEKNSPNLFEYGVGGE